MAKRNERKLWHEIKLLQQLITELQQKLNERFQALRELKSD